MYNIAVDCHTHTIFSGHAYSTYGELWEEAAAAGLDGFAVTDHFGRVFTNSRNGAIDSGTLFQCYGHVLNQHVLPRVRNGVKLYRGVEIDIDKKDGSLYGQDVPDDFYGSGKTLADVILSKADFAIASVHHLYNPGTVSESEGTAMYINAMGHPKVLMLGHIGRAGIPFHAGEVVKAAKEKARVIEINEHSFNFGGHIPAVCREIALRCAETGTQIAVNSDAHGFGAIGVFTKSLAMLEEIGFPQELILNADAERFERAIEVQG